MVGLVECTTTQFMNVLIRNLVGWIDQIISQNIEEGN